MAEKIQIQHRRHKQAETTPVFDFPAGGPDEITSELQIHTAEILSKIAHVLGEISIHDD